MEEQIAKEKYFLLFQEQTDTVEELKFIIRVAPEREWDDEARGFLAGWNAAKEWAASNNKFEPTRE